MFLKHADYTTIAHFWQDGYTATMLAERTMVLAWRWLLVVGCLGLMSSIVWNYFGIDGTFSLSYRFNDQPNYISRFTPLGRALERVRNTVNGEYYQQIISDPAYFSVQLPSAYPSIAVTLEYQNPAQNIIQLGARLNDADTSATGYVFQPLENKFVDASSWERLENDQYILLQRTPTYQSVQDFLDQPPSHTRVGTFLTNLELPLTDPDYQSTAAAIDLTMPLRGRHELYTYIKDEPLDFTITFHDINYAVGDDSFTIDVKRFGRVIATQTIGDDGDAGLTGTSVGPRTASVHLDNLSAGVYVIVLNCGDDIVFTHIQSPQDRLVFNKSIHLAGTPEYQHTIPDLALAPTTIYSDSTILTAAAKHYYGIQDVTFYNTVMSIDRVDIPFLWQNPVPGYFYSATFQNNDVFLTNDTAFALNADQWFDPWFGFHPLTQYTDLSQLDYIISTHYREPSRLRNWTTTTATFDLTKVQRADPTHIDFMLSAPGLDTATGGIKVRNITVTAHKDPITWSNLWQRLTAKFF